MTPPTRDEIAAYLEDIKQSVRAGRYRIALNENRRDNLQLRVDYVISSDDVRNILLSLETDDFSEKRQNEHAGYENEWLYIFGKAVPLIERFGTGEKTVPLYIKFNKLRNLFVIVISFHEQKHPLFYPFKQMTDKDFLS